MLSTNSPKGCSFIAKGAVMPRSVELDVRHYHAEGREPLTDILAASEELESGDCLILRNTFEPVPLFNLMRGRGFTHDSRSEAADDWFITFTKR